ncbi:hypothetical protein I3760_11G018400 [Carya illinoinensis]|nr:hypothetical protein I3760_11G018400 [Carya illinoinensis]
MDDYYVPDPEGIKVKFGDTMKCVKFYGRPGMASLRGKILDSFYNIPPNADFTLTYTDYDGDVITISDDIDANRAVGRGRIDVQLSNNKGVNTYAQSVESISTQLTSLQTRHPYPKIETGVVAKVSKSVLQQLREALLLHEALSKISEDIISKAVSDPVLVDLISKTAQTYLKYLDSQTHSGMDSTTPNVDIDEGDEAGCQ